ncbi:MAG: thioredoxin family protein [Thermoplasmata archaeon]
MKIEIFGTGCRKCKRLEKNVETAVKELGIEAKVEKVQDINEIASRGVMMTPALAIEGDIKSSGKILNPEDIKKLLK